MNLTYIKEAAIKTETLGHRQMYAIHLTEKAGKQKKK